MWALAVSLCLIPPVSGPVERPYVAPACRFCPGNQAVDFAAELGETVVAPVSGTIRFVGVVAGTGYVTVEVVAPTTNRRLVTVGGLTSLRASRARGRVIGGGVRLGMAAGATGSTPSRSFPGEAGHLQRALLVGEGTSPGERRAEPVLVQWD